MFHCLLCFEPKASRKLALLDATLVESFSVADAIKCNFAFIPSTSKIESSGVCSTCFGVLRSYHELLNMVKRNYNFFDCFVKIEELKTEVAELVQQLDYGDVGIAGDFDIKLEHQSELEDYNDDDDYEASIAVKKEPRTRKPTKSRKTTKTPVVDDPSTLSERKRLEEEADQKVRDSVDVKCHLCNIPFSIFREVNKHFRSTHPSHHKFGFLKCCGKTFYQRTRLLQHIETHTDPEKFKCSICPNKTFDTNHNLMHHVQKIHERESVLSICHSCGKEFPTAFALRMHMPVHEVDPNRSFECYACKRTYINITLLKRHISCSHVFSTESFVCDICPKVFTKKSQYKSHMRLHKEKQKLASGEGLKCPHCESCFGSQYRVNHHVRRVHSTAELKCEICSKVMKHADYLRSHMELAHGKVERIPCELCGNLLKNKTCWKAHMKRHRENHQEQKCEECGHICKSKEAHSSHVKRNHRKTRNLPCQYCSKLFMHDKQVKEHEATHTGINLYSCEFCSRGFKSSSSYHAHRKHDHPENYEQFRPSWVKPSDANLLNIIVKG